MHRYIITQTELAYSLQNWFSVVVVVPTLWLKYLNCLSHFVSLNPPQTLTSQICSDVLSSFVFLPVNSPVHTFSIEFHYSVTVVCWLVGCKHLIRQFKSPEQTLAKNKHGSWGAETMQILICTHLVIGTWLMIGTEGAITLWRSWRRGMLSPWDMMNYYLCSYQLIVVIIVSCLPYPLQIHDHVRLVIWE